MPARDDYPPKRWHTDLGERQEHTTIVVTDGPHRIETTDLPDSSRRYFRKTPAQTTRRMGVLYDSPPDYSELRGNWQGDDGQWLAPCATVEIAAEILRELAAGLLEIRPERCP